MYLAIRAFTAIMNKTWLICAIKRNYNKNHNLLHWCRVFLSFSKMFVHSFHTSSTILSIQEPRGKGSRNIITQLLAFYRLKVKRQRDRKKWLKSPLISGRVWQEPGPLHEWFSSAFVWPVLNFRDYGTSSIILPRKSFGLVNQGKIPRQEGFSPGAL